MLEAAAAELRLQLITVCAYLPGRLEPEAARLRELAAEWPLALAGPAAGRELASECHAQHLAADPVTAAAAVAVQPTP